MTSKKDRDALKELTSGLFMAREVCRKVYTDLKELRAEFDNSKMWQMKSRCDDIQRILEFNDLTFDTSKKNIELVSKAVNDLYELQKETDKLKAEWDEINRENRDRNEKFIDEIISSMIQLCHNTEPKSAKTRIAISSTIQYCKDMKRIYTDQRVLISELLTLQNKLNIAIFEDNM